MLTRCCTVPVPKCKPAFNIPKRTPCPRRSKHVKKTNKDGAQIAKEFFDKTNDMWMGMTDTFDLDEE
jgi:hypothetical protein